MGRKNVLDVFHFVVEESFESYIRTVAHQTTKKALGVLDPTAALAENIEHARAWHRSGFNGMVRLYTPHP
jgi:hypothetical protein